MAIWMSRNINIRRSLKSHDSFCRRKFKNWAPTSRRQRPILWQPTVRFELRAKVAEELDLEMCSYGQLSEVQMLCDLDLGSGQGHVNIYSTCRTTCTLNHVTVTSCTTEIWPIEFRQISILDEVWTLVISFPRWKFKNRAPTSCSPGPILWPPTISFELHAKMAEEIDVEKCTFCNSGSSVICGRGLPTHQIRWKPEKLFVDVRTDGHTWVPIY